MWHKVNKVERFGNGWIVRYSILTCCYEHKATVVINQEKKPTKKQIEYAINNKG